MKAGCRFRLIAPLVLLFIGCTEPTGLDPEPLTRVNAAWVTGAAAAAVDPMTGLFRLTAPPTSVLGVESAESAALAYARMSLNTFGSNPWLEQEHGGPIAAWNELVPCGRTAYATSAFGPAPDPAPRQLKRFVSSSWAVTLCGPDGRPDLSVGVADAVSGARMDGADYLIADIDSLAQMHSMIGVPAGWPRGLSILPEDAVGALFRATQVRISEAPVGHVYWSPGMTVPAYLTWELVLETSVVGQLESGAQSQPVTRIRVARFSPGGPEDDVRFLVPEDAQPTAVWVPYPVQFDPPLADSVAVPVIHPLNMQRITFP